MTSRTKYVFDLFFGSLIPVPYRITDDADRFSAHDGPRLQYGAEPLTDQALFIRAHGLLERHGIERLAVESTGWEDAVGFFPVEDGRSALPFDLFAEAFFLVSRFEEYWSGPHDEHGRFLPHGSVLHREGCFGMPIVNAHAEALRTLLSARFPRFEWPGLPFTALSTIDVDVAYAYRGRALIRTIGAAARQVATRAEGSLVERLQVLAGRRQDPYDSYDWLRAVHAESGVELMYFLLVGREGRLDRNLRPDSPAMRALVRELADKHLVGLHPSYASNGDAELVSAEARTLESLTGTPVFHSRQHFLRLRIPRTYRTLLDCGIQHDYSMGYASEPGFRAGIAQPFRFYDLEKEQATDLTVHPLAYMDGTLKVYQQQGTEEAKATITSLADSVRRTGGHFISLWHNNTVADYGPWTGWRDVFMHSLAAMRGPE